MHSKYDQIFLKAELKELNDMRREIRSNRVHGDYNSDIDDNDDDGDDEDS